MKKGKDENGKMWKINEDKRKRKIKELIICAGQKWAKRGATKGKKEAQTLQTR
jgi:hypothetical protein